MREGRFVRLSGNLESTVGDEASFSVFGKLIQNSDEGSVYSFTGRITERGIPNKIIYTSKISEVSSLIPDRLIDETARITGEVKENEIVIRILKGAYQPSLFGSYREGVGGQEYYQQNTQRASVGYFFPERLTITPGITLTFFNDDDVSHKIVSARRDTNSRGIGNPTPDGKIVSEEILPGGSWSYTNERIGFIFLMDPNYPWMSMDITSFSELNPDIIGSQKNRIQNN